ncbi:MAG: hypothetical protein A2Y25_02645 [Candidatus Melainabacteria bacterium GWF2_37_15]|nr:MAG: hypothetical protein A2Y25_02645 [Candidatus Melainabacteria bacterium GWF2_37_15]
MDAQNYQEMQNNLIEKAEQFKKKACEMEEQVSANINDLMVNTADRLDQAADKMKSTAEFFRNKNVNTIKEDVSVMVRNNPGKSLLGAIAIGFLVGKILFR